MKNNTPPHKLLAVILYSFLFLAVPALASVFVSDFNWGLEDYITVWILICTTLLILHSILRYFKNKMAKLLLSFLVIVIAVLIWVEMAVGIFD